MAAVGIDLGTTNSLVAVFEDKGPRLVPNALGEYLTPSAVGLADDGKTILVGSAAKSRLVRYPETTRARFKRHMGSGKTFKLGRKIYSSTDLSALVLAALKRDVETDLGHPVTEAVISVPAYFNAIQRQATKDAAEIAGLKVSRLINEPTAAALANGVQNLDDESTFAVLDLGGGTFDVSILELFEGVMEVRASSGDAFLGGEDFTDAVARHLAERANRKWADLSVQAKAKLRSFAERMKRALANSPSASAPLEIGGTTVDLSMTTDEFAEVTAPLLARLSRPIERSLYDAGLSADEVDRVILVGGATRMATVRTLAVRIFRKLPERKIDPDHAIALGAAVQAGLMTSNAALDDVVMTDVAPFSMGIASNHTQGDQIIRDAFAPIIERNTILPASRVQYFATTADNQTAIRLAIYQGEAALADDNVLLGEMILTVPPGPRGKEQIEVRFTYDVSGLLAVDARVVSLNKTVSTVIENLAAALSEGEKAARLREMEKFKISPREDASNIALLEAIRHLYEMLLGQDRSYVLTLLGQFEAALDTQDPKRIAKARAEIAAIVEQIEAGFVR